MKLNKYWKLIFSLFFIFQITVITEEEKELGKKLDIYSKSTRINALAYSPDGKFVAVGLFDGTIKIWNSSTLQIEKIISADKNRVKITFQNLLIFISPSI